MKKKEDIYYVELVDLLKDEIREQRHTISNLEQELGGMKMLRADREHRNRRIVFWVSVVVTLLSIGVSIWCAAN